MPAAVEGEISGEPGVAPDLPVGAEPFVVIKQDVEIEVNFREKSISGVSTIHLFTINPDQDEILLDARQCEIDLENVTVDGFKTTASFSDPYDLARTPRQWQIGAAQHHIVKRRMAPLRPARRPEVPNKDRVMHPCCVPADRALRVCLRPQGMFADEPRRTLKIKASNVDKDASLDGPDPNDEKNGIKISIPFRSKNIRDGLHFVGVDEGDPRYAHAYTRHSLEPGTASCIFPCVDDPASRHPWKISIKCPRTLGDVFEQPLATQQTAAPSPNGGRKRKLGERALPPPPSAPLLSEEDKLMEMTVVCSGNLAGEQIDPEDGRKRIMTFESQLSAAQHIAFAIGPFEHVQLWSEFRTEEADEKLGANAAKIHAYCLPHRAHEVRHTCAPIVAAADYFAPEFGRYPFESYKVVFVDDMVPDTVAATSMSLCSTRLLYPEDTVDPEVDVTRTLVHALASQYFGVHIVPNQRSDSWLIVGIQWFMTDQFMRTICGNNWYRFHLKSLSDKLVEVDVHRPSLHDLGEHLHIGDFELEFMSLKAPLVLFILDQRMSKIPGSMGIVRVISHIVSNANINATITSTSLSDADFRRACEKKSQYRPDELWQQWVHSAGCPKLLIKQRFNKKNLNVDIAISQTQTKESAPKAITKDDFLKELLEEVHEVWAGTVPKLFTGPFTVRIHEADGTPYEHYLAITDKDKAGTTLQIAYNTKYKRMKRTKKATAAAATATAADRHDIQEDDIVYFNMLGDVLMTPRDVENWGLQDWSEAVQSAMDQESYEWIRLDCNFEWLCEMVTDMPGYMYLAQLQQDRDVVAHQDAMLFFKRGRRHGMASTIETRTAMDRRYYHGIRTMAIEDLPKQADADLNYIGTAQLILLFRHFFCDRMVGKNGSVTFPPVPNDFTDKAQYAVQCALPAAIARTRENGRCSRQARNFLLDLLLFNDNSDNDYSDQLYIAKLLDALTTSIIPDRWDGERDLLSSLGSGEDDEVELKRFIERTIEEIDKYRRMDEWTSTYQNIWTRTALRCKMRLMKANVIRTAPLEFVRYLQDGNYDLIRIDAFDCLVELGMLAKVPIMKLLLACVSSDPSPFVRDRLFKIFSKGMAAVALGESKAAQLEPEAAVDDSGLIVELGEAEIQQRRLAATRNQSIQAALQALKEELKGNTELQAAMWGAVESPSISAKEKFQLLTLCSAMFEADDSLLMTFNYPKYWKCTREPAVEEGPAAAHRPNGRKRCMVKFTMHYRTEPRHKLVMEPAPPPLPWEPRPTEVKRIKLSSKPSFSGPSNAGPPTPAPPARKDSISVTVPRPAVSAAAAVASSDSIAVQPFARPPTPSAASPPPPAPAPSQQPNGGARPAEKRPKPFKKRKSDETDNLERPKKVARAEGSANGRPRKIVRLAFTAWDRLPSRVRENLRAEKAARAVSSTIVATPAGAKRTALPGHGDLSRAAARPASPAPERRSSPGVNGSQSAVKKRKPLPSAAPQHSSPPPPPPSSAPASWAEPAEPKKKVIKLKLKPTSQATPPHTPR